MKCELCPHRCGADRETRLGRCNSHADITIARAALHHWEEPPLSGVAGSGAVFFSHCPLRCVYCQNAEIAQGQAGLEVEVARLAEICLELEAQGALNVNFVTPTHYSMHIRKAVKAAHENGLGIPVVWNTSGYERVPVIEALADTVDIYLADFKYADPALAARYSHAPDYPEIALAAIQAMVRTAGAPAFDERDGAPRMTQGVIVRHLVLPGALEHSKRALEVAFDRLGDTVLYSIMNQYTPVIPPDVETRFPELGRRVSDEAYEELLDYADSLGMDDYFWQEGPTAAESFIPAWDATGVYS